MSDGRPSRSSGENSHRVESQRAPKRQRTQQRLETPFAPTQDAIVVMEHPFEGRTDDSPGRQRRVQVKLIWRDGPQWLGEKSCPPVLLYGSGGLSGSRATK
jgi:hypothetical protein